MNLILDMNTKMLDLLNPLISPMSEFGVQEIQVQEFGSASDAEELMERFRALLPGAFLSVPRLTYNTNPSSLRICDVTLAYGFLIGMADRRDETVRQNYAAVMHEEHSRYLMLRPIDRAGIMCTNIDFLRPQTWEYVSEPETSVTYLTMEVTVRNWQINTPV